MADTAVIKTEIQTDPAGLGYGTWASVTDDGRVHGLLHDPTKRTLAIVLAPSWAVVACFDPAEFTALTAIQQAQLTTLLSAGSVNLAASGVRTILAGIFPSGGPTRTALIALRNAQQQTQSRIVELGWGPTVVDDITFARTH